MEQQLATLWAQLPELAREAVSRARALPDLALYAIAAALVLALLSRSLAAIVLAAAILWIPAALLLAHPADDRSWLVLWIACAASLLATASAYLRRRLAKQARTLRASLTDLRNELTDLRTKYEHELVSRGSDERDRQMPASKPFMIVPRADRSLTKKRRALPPGQAVLRRVAPKT